MAPPPNRPDDAPAPPDDRLREWMARYGPPLRRYFRRSVGPEEAEDLVQEVFLAMQTRGTAGIDHIGRYVFRVAANVMAARNRPGAWRWSDHATLDELILADECSPERALIAKEALEDLLAGLKAAPPRAAQAFILHRFEQLSYEEIARRMGVSVKAVEMNVRRTMERIMASMEARS
jgi:RNA polymerase sigma factor (sigma-70 family)